MKINEYEIRDIVKRIYRLQQKLMTKNAEWLSVMRNLML